MRKAFWSTLLSIGLACALFAPARAQTFMGQSDSEDYDRPYRPYEYRDRRSNSGSGQDWWGPGNGSAAIMAVNRSVSLSYLLTRLYYLEPSGVDAFNVGSNYDDYESGNISGLQLAASWMTRDDWYLHGQWSLAQGNVAYTGYYQGPTPTPAGGNSHAIIQNYDFRFGKGFPVSADWMLTPYAAFGGRHWVRELGPGTLGDYVESYNHYFLAMGGLIQWNPVEQFVITGDAAIGRTIAPTINDPPDGLNHTALGVSPLIKLGMDFDYQLMNGLHAFTGFDFQTFGYGQSGVQFTSTEEVLEPDSHTQEFNFNLGFRLAFDQLSFSWPDFHLFD